MKKWYVLWCIVLLCSCASKQSVNPDSNSSDPLSISDKESDAFQSTEGEEVRIGDEDTEYEIIIIDPGFYSWLKSIARPEGYYSQTFLESRNRVYVINWNQRALGLNTANPDLYQLRIDYDPAIDYGYEVNYKLYNYFIYFQRKYNERLGPFLPRI